MYNSEGSYCSAKYTSDYALINGLVLDDNESGLADVAVLTYMAHTVADVVAELVTQPEVIYPFLSYREEYFHAFHRMVIYSQPAITGQDVPFVGFVSQRLPQVSGELGQKLSEVDKVLIMELAEQTKWPRILGTISSLII